MSWQPPANHPWRSGKTHGFRMRPRPAKLIASEVHAARTSYAAGYTKASIARMLDVKFHVITAALKPTYQPFWES